MPSRKKSLVSDGRQLCRSLMDAVNDVILVFDLRSLRILDANKRAAQVYGYTRRELIRKNVLDLTSEAPRFSDLLRASGKSIERTHVTKTGEEIDFLVSVSLIDYWGKKALLSINRDITGRKRIESAIAANEKKLRLLVHSISEIVVMIDQEGRIKFISPQVERVLELRARDLLNKSIFDFIHPEDTPRASAEYAQTLQTPGEGPPSTLRLRNLEGDWIPMEIIANNQLSDPDVGGVIFTARDLRFRKEAEAVIQESNQDLEKPVEERALELAKANAALRLENQQRRHTEAELKQSLSLLYATLESTADGILVVSTGRLISGCNQRFMDMWHIPRMAVAGLRDEELLALAIPQLQDPKAFLAAVQELYAHPDAVQYNTFKLKDGRIFNRYTQPQRVGEDIVGRVWSFRDVTQAHRLEEELRQAQKMEAVGRLAGGVAHDFNNLLMLISGYGRLILGDPHLSAANRESAEQVMDAARRAASMTRQLLAFSRKQPVLPQLLDLNAVAGGMEQMLSRLVPESIRLSFKLSQQPLPVKADPSQIELMIMNLVLNARDAMPNGGSLRITTRREEMPESTEKGQELLGQSFASLEVVDTGHGMAPEVKERIFEPFFTTKEVGKGTGLGLSTAYGIVEQAGGHIDVESEPGRGSSFRVSLPLAESAGQPVLVAPALTIAPVSTVASAEQPALLMSAEAARRETILLVEDEAGIRTMTRGYLESQGYTVLEAGDGSEAIRVADQHPGRIDLVLADVIMPGTRGNDLVRAIRKARPEVRAMYITGYAEAGNLDSDVPVLEKPFEFPDLGKRVREVLDRKARQHPRARRSA